MEHVEVHSRVQARHFTPMWVRPEFPGATEPGQEQVASVISSPFQKSFLSSLLPQSNVMRAFLEITVFGGPRRSKRHRSHSQLGWPGSTVPESAQGQCTTESHQYTRLCLKRPHGPLPTSCVVGTSSSPMLWCSHQQNELHSEPHEACRSW